MHEKRRTVVPEQKVPAAPKEAPRVKGIKQFLFWVMYLQGDYVCLTVLFVCVDVGPFPVMNGYLKFHLIL